MNSKSRSWIVVGMLSAALALAAWAQERKDQGGGAPPAYEAIAKAYAQAATPGPSHAQLARYLGEWDVAFRYYYGTGGTPTESIGKATFRWLLEGRWLIEEVDGQFMGQPFKGFNLIGYDNVKKQYVSSWIDNMSTSMVVGYGGIDAKQTTITTFSPVDDLAHGERDKVTKNVTHFVDENTVTFVIQDVIYGEPKTLMEATYKRRK